MRRGFLQFYSHDVDRRDKSRRDIFCDLKNKPDKQQTRRKGRPKNNILIVGFRRVVIKEVIYRFTQIYQQYFRLFGGLFPQLEKL